MRVNPEDRYKAGLDLVYTDFDVDTGCGFVYPDQSGGWMLFIPKDDEGYAVMGTFPSTEVFGLDWEDYREMMIREIGDRPSAEAMDFLCCLYMDPRNEDWTLIGSVIANDDDCIDWAINYLYFVKWFGEGDPIFSTGSFSALVDIIMEPKATIELLESKGAHNLADELRELSRHYVGMTSHKFGQPRKVSV